MGTSMVPAGQRGGPPRTFDSRSNTPDFISPELWPPCSPDLNPVDYEISGCMQERVYKKPVHDLTELKQRLVKIWANFDHSVVDVAIDQWRRRLQASVSAEGQHFEHEL